MIINEENGVYPPIQNGDIYSVFAWRERSIAVHLRIPVISVHFSASLVYDVCEGV